MNLRNNKGYAGVDISISAIILVIIIPFIGGMIYNISKNNNAMDRKTFAINLATNVLEIAKATEIEYVYSNSEDAPDVENSNNYITNLNNKIQNKITDAQIKTEGEKEYIIFSVEDSNKSHYKIVIDVLDFAKKEENIGASKEENIVKTVNVNITYSLANKEQKLELNTVIAKE